MDGLEAAEIRLSEVKVDSAEGRIDSEYYKKENLHLNEQLQHIGFNELNLISNKISDGTHFTPRYTEKGIPFISALNVKENFLDINSNYNYISLDEHRFIYKRCNPEIGDVLLRKVGVGARYACVIPKNTFEFSLFVSVALIKCNDKLNAYYLSTFINSKFGQKQLLRFNKGISQPDLHLEDISRLKVPIVSFQFQNIIEKIVIRSHRLNSEVKSLYSAAENLLLSHLGLLDYTPSKQAVAIKSFSSSFGVSGRLDSEYYQPKYEEIEKAIKNIPFGYSLVKDKFTQNTETYKNINDYHNYIEIGDIDVSNGIAAFNKVATEDLPANAKTKLNKNDIVYSTVRPYRGAVAICNFDEDIVVSGAFVVLHEKSDFSKECLFILLRSSIYKELIMKYNVGSSYPVVRDNDVLNLPIPILDQSIQTQIAEKIQQSFALKNQSKELLDLTKTAVEVAIEQGEDKAMELLEGIEKH